ncbi:MAG: ShlB/FhaC/HecB family hemolysin secretion/activation protein [Rhodocyclaceae bacterium]|nr:ShlB/FhaC/HecB family hemolysin secretion/activation protein [Rhodocyclaceae bacterium]MDZ4216526.1 ShlB/FhaC/HecB family hemolysin secretion/activation protein [Rhodocyclaceae bacterium]
MSFSKESLARIGLLYVVTASCVHAQTTPDAGLLRQQIERQLPQVLPEERKPLTVLPPAYKPAPGLSVTVKAFRFVGNTLMSQADLAPAVASYLDRPLDFTALQAATAAVSEAYRAAGWLVRVYLPRQEIQDGIVTLQIVEGIFGKLRFEGTLSMRIDAGRVEATVAAAQPAGQPLKAGALDRAMLLLDDLPGIAVSGNLAPGSGSAESDLVLKLADEALLNGEASLDNTGLRSTGRERVTANASLNSPLQIGDQVIANLVHTEGSDYIRLAYTAPVGYDGLRLGVNASRMDYKVISEEFKAARITGASSTWGLDAQYPLIRSRTHNLFLSASWDDKIFDNEANGAVSSKYGVRNLNVGLMANLFDRLGGGGANMANMMFTVGNLDLEGSPNKSSDTATTRTHGGFTKLRYAMSRQQALTEDFSLYALFTGQSASKNLDSSEKFYLGGSSGVRAYPASEGGGSEGTMLNLELRWRAMNHLLITGFYDWGSVKVNKDNNFAGAPALNRFDLDGLGASVTWNGPLGVTLKGVYARRLGSNPNRNATTGRDQDGSLIRDRLWLTASLPF